MRQLLVLAVTLLLLVSSCYADTFQFRTGDGSPLVSAPVLDGDILVGYTNSQGIITINRPNGQRTFTIRYMGQELQVALNFTGSSSLRVITVR